MLSNIKYSFTLAKASSFVFMLFYMATVLQQWFNQPDLVGESFDVQRKTHLRKAAFEWSHLFDEIFPSDFLVLLLRQKPLLSDK